ncbi:DEAD-box helicase Dbp80 [Drosophila guanche]|uniref:RNA helicase n=2 Tax=Drosophila guanche TaxID=7266 RepID=A0A3B0KT15_DROGU|nr:DEAD-box helicase Dbp80 [Drosophila guanche]SPP88371.1 blast:DEAD-box helicase Dbp80 [Drosophila guanche]
MTDWAKKAEDQEVAKLVDQLQIQSDENTFSTRNNSCIYDLPATKNNEESEPDVADPAETSLLIKILGKGLVNTKLSLDIQQKNPNSPLHSVKTFEALHLKEELLKGIYAMGFNTPSKIQETALPTLLADPPQNMIAQSQSGTGKTAAFVLAMLSRVNVKLNHPQVLCLSPTYELAIQTGEVAARMGQFCPEIKLRFAVRGEEVERNQKITEHILIGTPGKMLDWGYKFRLFDMKKISVFVLDEADVMIATQGHHDQCLRIHKLLNQQCQMLFFSATYDREVMDFAQLIVTEPTIIRLNREQESLDNIKQYYVKCKNEEGKYNAIQNIYGCISIGQAIIFCHTRRTAAWLASKMTSDGHSVAVLSGDLTVEQRLAVLDRFRSGLQKVLITTNVLSRGIDIEQVTIVVNFDLPVDIRGNADCETYLHRIGRTGRFGKSGIAINLVSGDKCMAVCNAIEKHFKKDIHILNTDSADDIEKIGN